MFRFLVRQFGNPRGPVGHLAGLIMSTRPSNRKRNAWAVTLATASGPREILEIGCGPGMALEMFCRTTGVLRVVGIDHSPLMVSQARRRLAEYMAVGRADVTRAGADALPFASKQFDCVVAINSFAFWRAVPGALDEASRVLRDGGRLIIVHQPRGRNADDDATRTFAESVMAELSTAGFSDIQVDYLPLSPAVAGVTATSG